MRSAGHRRWTGALELGRIVFGWDVAGMATIKCGKRGPRMARWWVILGAVNGFLAVAFGAFGAHGLAQTLKAHETEKVFATASNYHMYHALALLAVGWALGETRNPAAGAAGWCFLVGIVLFSGSLYALAVTNVRWLGAITPIGGTLFLAGWLLLAWAACRLKPE